MNRRKVQPQQRVVAPPLPKDVPPPPQVELEPGQQLGTIVMCPDAELVLHHLAGDISDIIVEIPDNEFCLALGPLVIQNVKSVKGRLSIGEIMKKSTLVQRLNDLQLQTKSAKQCRDCLAFSKINNTRLVFDHPIDRKQRYRINTIHHDHSNSNNQ